jgi:hypothetical protein
MRYILTTLLPLALGGAAYAQDSLRVQLHGMVLDGVSQQPVYDVLVEWYDGNGKRQGITQTNSEGRYALFVNPTPGMELRVQENGYKDFVYEVPPFKEGEAARELDIWLEPK